MRAPGLNSLDKRQERTRGKVRRKGEDQRGKRQNNRGRRTKQGDLPEC